MKTSKGEEKVIEILKAARLTFRREVSFKGLYGARGKLLRFDFLVYNLKGQVLCLIEVDGAQHFQYTSFFHKTKNEFYRQVEWDRRKNKFCLMNKIPLLRVPYWDIDTLTFEKLFTTESYRVKNKDHNMILAREVKQ